MFYEIKKKKKSVTQLNHTSWSFYGKRFPSKLFNMFFKMKLRSWYIYLTAPPSDSGVFSAFVPASADLCKCIVLLQRPGRLYTVEGAQRWLLRHKGRGQTAILEFVQQIMQMFIALYNKTKQNKKPL